MPVPRQQLVEAGLRRVGGAGEDVGEPSVWIYVVEPGRGDQGREELARLCAQP